MVTYPERSDGLFHRLARRENPGSVLTELTPLFTLDLPISPGEEQAYMSLPLSRPDFNP